MPQMHESRRTGDVLPPDGHRPAWTLPRPESPELDALGPADRPGDVGPEKIEAAPGLPPLKPKREPGEAEPEEDDRGDDPPPAEGTAGDGLGNGHVRTPMPDCRAGWSPPCQRYV